MWNAYSIPVSIVQDYAENNRITDLGCNSIVGPTFGVHYNHLLDGEPFLLVHI